MNYLNEKFDFLKPISNSNLVRIGINKDGGYIVDLNLFCQTKYLLSLGLGDDWSFEEQFLEKNTRGKISIYDHTVNFYSFLKPLIKYLKRFLLFKISIKDLNSRFSKFIKYLFFVHNKRVKYHKEKISLKTETGLVSISEAIKRIENQNKIILKVDIEGSEYEVIDDMIRNNKIIEMIIIEFHEIGAKEKIFINSIRKLQEFFFIVHLHGNNHCEQCATGIPETLEITLINKNYIPKNITYEKNFPRKQLDYPNNPEKKDIFFSFK